MLHIKNDYYIKAGARSYILMKKLSKKDTSDLEFTEEAEDHVKGYKNIGYYSKIETAIKTAMEEMVRDQINNNADTELSEIVEYLAKLRKEMDDLLTEKVQGL